MKTGFIQGTARKVTYTYLLLVGIICVSGSFPCFSVPVYAEVSDSVFQQECHSRQSFSVIADINDGGTLVLDNGERVVIRDIRLPSSEKHSLALLQLRRHEGRYIAIRSKTGPDRWGLYSAQIILADTDQDDESLATILVQNGLAYVDSAEHHFLCDHILLQKEETARNSRLGIWKIQENRIRQAGETENLSFRTGIFTLVEGRILSVGIRKNRIYLNFGKNWKQDFTAIIPQAIIKYAPADQFTPSELTGRKVRIRGIIDKWNGPLITLQSLDMIEMIED